VLRAGEAGRLNAAEKKRILTEHIFGVDIDRQAVEATRLSLLLEVLETESNESLGKQLALIPQLSRERALPNGVSFRLAGVRFGYLALRGCGL
jgi:hypothetical protein